MARRFKVSSATIETLKAKTLLIKNTINLVTGDIARYQSAALARLNSWKWNKDDLIDRHTKKLYKNNYKKEQYDVDPYSHLSTSSWVFDEDAYNQACSDARAAAEAWVDERLTKYEELKNGYNEGFSDVQKYAKNLYNVFRVISECITEIEGFEVDLEKAKDKKNSELQHEIEQARIHSSPDLDELYAKVINLDFNKIVTVDANGNKIISYEVFTKYKNTDEIVSQLEAVNSATTEVEMTATDATLAASVGLMRGYDARQIDQYVGREVSRDVGAVAYARRGGYLNNSEGSDKKLQELYTKAGGKGKYTPEKAQELMLERERKEFTPEELAFRQGIREYIADRVESTRESHVYSPVTAITMAEKGFDIKPFYDPSATPSAVAPEPTPVAHTPSVGGCGGYGGGYTPARVPVAHTGMASTAVIGPSPAITNESIAGRMVSTPVSVNPVTAAALPKPLTAAVSSKFIDQQAKEIFYGRSAEQIAADRANALSIVDKAFAGEGVDDFKEVLKKGGFDDVDIDIIMDNKEIAVTAYILASESKGLTDIANQLAMANNIANFDTMYDNGLNRMSLENGLSQSKLMAEVDEEVADARTNLKNARSKYNSSVKKANDSIEEANKKKEEMEEIKKRIVNKSGEDSSKWDDEDVEAYNKAVEEYNEANKAANEAHKEAMSDKELLDEAEQKLTETEERVAKEYLEQQAQQEAQQGGQQGGEPVVETPEEEVVELQQTDPNVEAETVQTETTKEIGESNVDVEVTSETPRETGNFVSPDEAKDVPKSNMVSHSNDNVEPERRLTSDDLKDLFDNLEDVSDAASTERTLDAVDLSSLAPEDRTIPNLGLDVFESADNTTVVNTGSSTTVDIGSTKDINNLSDSSFNMVSDADISNDVGNILPEGNSLVSFADSAAQQASEKTKDFQDNKFNGLGNLSMGANSLEAFATESTYTSKGTSETNNETKEAPATPEAPKKDVETVAGVQVDSSEAQKHTDGVLIDSGDQVASEVSEDGRSLEYVEIE